MEKISRKGSSGSCTMIGGAEKKNLLAKTIERCRSLGYRRRPGPPSPHDKACRRSRSADGGAWAVPAGCFAVLVGPTKERFAVRAECANHPLFRALLDEAETEYGFAGCDGPLELPCDVEVFQQVMWEMEQGDPAASPRCGFSKGSYHGYQLMSPTRLVVAGRSY